MLAIICLALICFSARDGLVNLYDRWMYEEEYGYGFLIAAIVPLLLWRKWPNILTSKGSKWPGFAIVLVAQLCTILAAAGESYYLEQLSFVVSLAGLALAIFGFGANRSVLPIAFLLLLTIPLPYTLQAMLTIKLQLVSTQLGVMIIQLLGIPVYVEGNIIDLGSYKLQVAEACSGLRYLLPLTCIAYLIAYLYKAPLWKKSVVVFSALPLTIILNSFRIAVTAVLVAHFGSKMAEGFLHEFEGWVVFLVGVFLLGSLIWALQGFRWSNVEIEQLIGRTARSEGAYSTVAASLPLLLSVFVCVGTFAATSSVAAAYNSTGRPSRISFDAFPEKIDQWRGHPTDLDDGTLDALKATDYYSGDFVEAPNAPAVDLFVAYYDFLAKGAAIHSPKVCLPGSGWEFATFEERNFSELVNGVPGTYNSTVIQKGEQKILMYYWYQQRERRTANEFSMKYYLLVDNLFKSRKDGALVRLYTPILASAGDKGEEQAASRLRAFAQTTKYANIEVHSAVIEASGWGSRTHETDKRVFRDGDFISRKRERRSR